MHHNGAAFLEEFLRLVADVGFAFTILGVVVIATVLAFGFGASLEIVVAILVLGVTTAIVEKELRAKN